jgi:hypothetical protein
MATEALVKKVKELMTLAKSGKQDDALKGYGELFTSAEFMTYPPEERRHALKLVVNARVPPNRPSPAIVAAHRAAMKPLEVMLTSHNEPEDHQLLGICCLYVDQEKRAGELFRNGLQLERSRNPQSDLCGSLMKWVAAV